MRSVRDPNKLGVPYEHDGKVFVDAIAHADLAVGLPVVIHPDKDVMAKTAVPATLAVLHYIGAPQKAVLSGEVAQILVGGKGQILVDGTTDVAAGDYLEVIDAGVAAIKDGSTRTVNCCCMALAAQASNSAVLTNVQFIGIPVVVAAS
jgi:hypothetical protein